MSVTPGLGAFNKDKVANKFGIQLKPKDAPQRSSTTVTTGTSTVTKNKTIGDFRTDKSTNGFLTNTNRPAASKTPETTRKVIEKSLPTNKSTSGLVNTSVNINQQSTTLTSNVNHSTPKSKESLTTTTKRSSITPTERAVSPTPPIKRPNVPKTETPTQDKKDLPLYKKRQSSKPLDSTPSTPAATTTTTSTSLTSLKR